MRGLLTLLASLVAVIAPATLALKVPLTKENRNCAANVQPNQPGTGTGTGFVTVVKTGSNKVVANVVLQNAAHDTAYGYRLIQVPNTPPCGWTPADGFVFEGDFTTDDSGYGHVNIQDNWVVGATAAWVALNNKNIPGTEYYTTDLAYF